jgi:sugar lactone lactonase YvrE
MERLATGFGLIEGPVFDPAFGLYFSDVINGGVHLLDRAGNVSLVLPKRRGIGGMALHDWPYIFTDTEFESAIDNRFAAIKQGFDRIRGRQPRY